MTHTLRWVGTPVGTKRLGLAVGLMAAFAAISLASPRATEAHADFLRSDPPAGEAVRSAPERLVVWFTQELFRRAGANVLEVTGPDGERVDLDDVAVDEDDRTQMSVGLRPDLPPGEYTVAWVTLSATDGDTHEGSFTFTVDPSAPPPPAVTPAVEATAVAEPAPSPEAPLPYPAEPGTFPWWALVAGIGLAAAGVAGAWALRMDGDRR